MKHSTQFSKFLAVSLVAASGLLMSVAHADSTAAPAGAQQSVQAESPSTWDKIRENSVVAIWSDYHGPSLTDFNNRNQPDDVTVDGGGAQYAENVLTLGYKLDKDTTIAGIGHFNLFFDGGPHGPFNNSHGIDAQMLDPGLMFKKANLINNNGLTLTGMVYSYLGFAAASAHDNRAVESFMSIAPTFNLNYDIPGTTLSVGAYGYVRGYIPHAEAADPRLYKLNFCPTANWQFSKTVAANMWVDLVQATHKKSQNGLFNMSNPNADIEPGINWDISPKLALNPMLNIYPANMTMATTSFQMALVGKL